MGADDWEDMSDGDGGDWESGKAIAPLSSASGASLAGGGRSSRVGLGNGTPPKRISTEWGAAAGDAWGDEDDWRPGPAIASPAAVRSAGRAVRPSPSRSPASRITGFGGGGRRQSRGRILKRATALAFLAGAAYALLSAGAFGGARDVDPFDDDAIGDDVSDSVTAHPSSTTRARGDDAFASSDQARTTFGSSYARVPSSRAPDSPETRHAPADANHHDPPDVHPLTFPRAPVVGRDHDARADVSTIGSAAVDDALDALAFDDDRRRPSTVADETPSDGSDDAEDESTHDDRAERDAEEEALAAAAAKAAVAEAEAEANVEEPAVKVDDAEKDEGSDENPDDVDHLVEEDPSETKTTPPGFEPETAKVAKVAKVDDDLAPDVLDDDLAPGVFDDDLAPGVLDDVLAPDVLVDTTPDEDVSEDDMHHSGDEMAEDETSSSDETSPSDETSSSSTTIAAPSGASVSSSRETPAPDADRIRSGKTNRRDERRSPPSAEVPEDGPDLTDAENAAKVDAFLSDPKVLAKARADGPKHGYVLDEKTRRPSKTGDGERSDESDESGGRHGVDRRSLIERRDDATNGSGGDAKEAEGDAAKEAEGDAARETATEVSSRRNATRAIVAKEAEATMKSSTMKSSMKKSSIERVVAPVPAPAPGPSPSPDDRSGAGWDDGVAEHTTVRRARV